MNATKIKVSIRISEHAIKQFLSRIMLNDTLGRREIIEQIKLLFSQSRYISDNENGILFRNEDLDIEFIVKNKCIVTLFPVGKKGEN